MSTNTEYRPGSFESSAASVPRSPGPTLLEAVRALAPHLRERAAEADSLRRLPDTTWNDLVESGMLSAYQPARWGGGEVSPWQFNRAVIEVARVEACAGWIAGIIGVHPWQTALFPKEAQDEIWGNSPANFSSSSYAPTGKAEKVPGGYRLSGRWSFSSGCDHCTWVNLGAVIGMAKIDGLEVPDFRSFLLPSRDYRIDDNWFVAGLAGTGSKDIVVDGAFVPEFRSQSHWDYTLGRPLAGWELNPAPLYRLPWAAVFTYAVVASVLGAALGFLDVWTETAQTRKGTYGLNVTEDAYMQRLLAESKYTIDSGILRLQRDSEEMIDAVRAGEQFSLKRRAQLRYYSLKSTQLAVRQVDQLFEESGGHSTFLNHPLQRRYRDIKAMMSHAGLHPNPAAKLYGAAEFGLPILDTFL